MRGIRRIITIVCVMAAASAWAENNDFYAWWAEKFASLADPNTGLTVFPTLLIPMGGRYEGMGTAYTAMAQDSSFIESNPAASSLLSQTELSVFHHSWISDTNIEGVVYTVRFNDLGIGVGGKFLYVPFPATNELGATTASAYYSESVATLNISYNLFQSYYFYGLAAGANFKVAYRSIPEVLAANQSAIAFMADVGFQTSINLLKFYNSRDKNFSFGAVVKNLGISTLAGEQLPLMVTAGLAYSPLRPWTLTCDFNYPFSLDPVNAPAERWNIAVGTNVNITSFISVQSGILLKADNPFISLGAALNLSWVDLVMNYNLDLSGRLNPEDKLSIQAQFDLGDFGRKAARDEADRLYLAGLEEYALGHYESAIGFWKNVLELDPKYLPARENIDTVQQTIDLQHQMESRGND
jgi:tetratricopeptide (TPR) repeat protein